MGCLRWTSISVRTGLPRLVVLNLEMEILCSWIRDFMLLRWCYHLNLECPPKTCVLKAGSQLVAMLGGSGTFKRHSLVEGSRSLGRCLWRVYFVQIPFFLLSPSFFLSLSLLSLPISFLVTVKWAAFFHHTLLPWGTASLWGRKAKRSWTEASDTVNQKRSLLL